MNELIEKYIQLVKSGKYNDEVYKWDAISRFQENWDIDATNFFEMFKKAFDKKSNLIYQNSYGFLSKSAKHFPEETRVLFRELFNEKIPLRTRMEKHVELSEVLLEKVINVVAKKLQHQQDERTIAFLLTFRYPDKYFLYMDGVYQALCKYLNVQSKPAGQKLEHFNALGNEVIVVLKDTNDLWDCLKEFIPPETKFDSSHLIFQDVIYRVLILEEKNILIKNAIKSISESVRKKLQIEQHPLVKHRWPKPSAHYAQISFNESATSNETKKLHYELLIANDNLSYEFHPEFSFKENPFYYNYLKDWSHEKFVLHAWEIGFGKKARDPDHPNKKIRPKVLFPFKAGDDITEELIDGLSDQLIELYDAINENIEGLNMISQINNTNYWMYAPGESAIKWPEFFEQGIMALGWDELGNLTKYQKKEDIAVALREFDGSTGSKKNNAHANYEFVHEMQIGDVVIVKKGKQEFLGYGIVESDYYFDDERTDYKSCRKVRWVKNGLWKDEGHSTVLKTLTNITQYRDYVERLKQLIGIDSQSTKMKNTQPINQILYGPPGTGKTYKLKMEYFPAFTSLRNEVDLLDFKTRVRKYTWWQVIAAALYSSKEGRKVPDLANSKLIRAKHSPSFKYPDPNHILWNILQKNPELFEKVDDSVWKVKKQHVDDNYPIIKELHALLVDDFLTDNELKEEEKENYKFVTFHQSYAYEDFIEGIKPTLDKDSEEKQELTYEMGKGHFYDLCLKGVEMAGYESFKDCFEDDKISRYDKFQAIKDNPEKQVAIFIDEINRGNVSAIFGELITLIEEDKRLGAKNELWTELLYSKEKFGVPSNLYIIGTMNTADRSVEALDTALRRRFTFEEMIPNPSLIAEKGESQNGKISTENGEIDLVKLLTKINARINVLVDRDHTIGHAYFMDVDSPDSLKQAFKNKIIPLLQEYFYGDYKKMEMVIGAYFFVDEMKKSKDNLFAVTENPYNVSTGVYEFRDMDAIDFSIAEAVKVLLNEKEETVTSEA